MKLAAPITGSTRTIHLDEAYVPSVRFAYLQIESEKVLVAGGEGTTRLTVLRGQLGTERSAHDAETDVEELGGGGGGATDHGALTGLADDDHSAYPTTAEATTIAGTAVSTHAAAGNPHPTYLTSAEGDAAYDAIGGAAAAAGGAAAALADHAADPEAHGVAAFIASGQVTGGRFVQLVGDGEVATPDDDVVYPAVVGVALADAEAEADVDVRFDGVAEVGLNPGVAVAAGELVGVAWNGTATLVEGDEDHAAGHCWVGATAGRKASELFNQGRITAVADGAAGNGVTVAVNEAGAPDAPISVSVTGTDITVVAGSDSGSISNSTAQEFADAVNNDLDASALVVVTVDPGQEETVLTVGTLTTLVNGVDEVNDGTARIRLALPIKIPGGGPA